MNFYKNESWGRSFGGIGEKQPFAGLKLRDRIIWYVDYGLHCAKRLSGRCETINSYRPPQAPNGRKFRM